MRKSWKEKGDYLEKKNFSAKIEKYVCNRKRIMNYWIFPILLLTIGRNSNLLGKFDEKYETRLACCYDLRIWVSSLDSDGIFNLFLLCFILDRAKKKLGIGSWKRRKKIMKCSYDFLSIRHFIYEDRNKEKNGRKSLFASRKGYYQISFLIN